jgi:two-component system sensor histidine kinase ChiS
MDEALPHCIRILVVAALLFVVPCAHSQHGNTVFEHFSVADGLSAWPSTIYQDRTGYLWFASKNGIDRYDGYSFTTFTHELGNPSSITNAWAEILYEDRAGNFWVGTRHGLDKFDRTMGTFTHCLADSISGQVHIIYEDREGNVWVGTSRGLDKYDHSSGTFTHYFPDPDHRGVHGDGKAESRNVVLAIGEDEHGSLWIGSGDGLYIFDRTTQTFNNFRHDDQDPGSLAHNSVNAIYRDRTGLLWFGTGRGLDRFDRETGKFIHYWHYPDNVRGASSASAHWVTSIYQDRSGTFWLATRGGLVAFDQRSGLCIQYKHKPNDPGSFSGGAVTALCEDQEGTLWVGTSGGGLNAFDRKTGKFSHYVHDEQDPGSLCAGDIVCIYPERSGSLWIAASVDWWGGLNKLNRTKPLFAHYVGREGKPGSLTSSEINYVFEDKKGTIWISTTKGLETFDPKSEKFVQQEPHEPVWAIAEDRMGTLWIAGQHGGLYKRDQHRNVTRVCDAPRHEFQPVVVSICQAHDGTLWLGTRSGLFRLDPVTNKVRKVGPSEPLNGVYEDGSGMLWMGTTNDGMLCYDPFRDSTVRYSADPMNPATLTMNTIVTIHEDKAGILWIGSGLGLNRYDRSTGLFSHFTTKDGLPFDVVMGSVEDDHGNLWIGTANGISKFNPNTSVFKNYDVSYGLAGNDVVTFCKTRSGEMYFGGRLGLTRFQPDSVRDNLFVPPIVITSFRIFNQPVPLGKKIRLSYNENSLSFEFVALSYVSSEKNRYAYMMEGLDKDWVQSGTRRYAAYAHLDPGEYVFRVKGSNNDGVWNETGTAIAITITPPPWKTTWAYFLYAGLALGGLFSIRRYQIKKIDARHQLELSQMEAKTLKDVDETKSRFFANISHEFRTPLTLIDGPVRQLLSGEFTGDPRYYYRLILRNTERLLRLVNQLLDLSRLESGRTKLQVQRCDVGQLARSIAASFESLAVRKSIAFEIDIPSGSTYGWLDEDKFATMQTNLLANAFKFTNEGGEVSVSLRYVAQAESNAVVLTVADTGIGVASEHLQKIFDRFYQVDDRSTRVHEGTGLGLALTKELVQLHKGSINVVSTPGKGSSFTVTLPISSASYRPDEVRGDEMTRTGGLRVEPEGTDMEGTAATDEPRQRLVIPTVGKAVLLIVEDNIDMRAYIRESLEYMYDVIEARNGAEGVAGARQHVPDLIISDVMMPGMNGYELCSALKSDERTRSIPIILLTAKAAPREKIAGLEFGADDYLVKPFDPIELKARVENLLRQRSFEKQKREKELVGERARISRDMHDDIGARLTEIGIMTELMKRQIQNPDKVLPQAQKISETVREVISGISEIIWATNPAHDRLDDLLAYIRQNAGKYLEQAEIRCIFDFPDQIPSHHLEAEERRNVFLVVKEAINNIVKHSHAREVRISASIVEEQLKICVHDDGCGFPPGKDSTLGNGLRNMKQRMTDVEGTLTIESTPGSGTTLELSLPAREG